MGSYVVIDGYEQYITRLWGMLFVIIGGYMWWYKVMCGLL